MVLNGKHNNAMIIQHNAIVNIGMNITFESGAISDIIPKYQAVMGNNTNIADMELDSA